MPTYEDMRDAYVEIIRDAVKKRDKCKKGTGTWKFHQEAVDRGINGVVWCGRKIERLDI